MPPKGKQAAPAAPKDSSSITASSRREPVQPRDGDGHDDGDQGSSHIPESSPDHDDGHDLAAQLAATQQRIKQLEELAALQDRVKVLEASVRGTTKRSRRRSRDADDSDSDSDGGDIKIKNIATLASTSTFRKWDDWCGDLRRAFAGAPRKFRRDDKKILKALDNMDSECRARWNRYLDEQTDDRQQQLQEDWKAFVDWSLTLIKEAANLQPFLTRRLEKAKQGELQSPAEFHAYLDSLEKHLPRADEKARAYSFYAKLREELRDHIDLTSTQIPETRQEMVDLATRYWTVLTGGSQKRKAADDSKGGSKSGPHKAARTPSNTTPRGGKDGQTRDGKGPRTPRKNRPGPDGKLLKCYTCNSEEHLRPYCPKNPDKKDSPPAAKVDEVQGKGRPAPEALTPEPK